MDTTHAHTRMNWTQVTATTDRVVLQHDTHSEHYARAAEATDGDWYFLPHIGDLAPDDERYESERREDGLTRETAINRLKSYCANHPDGHSE